MNSESLPEAAVAREVALLNQQQYYDWATEL